MSRREAALLRARLHLRAGFILLDELKIQHGIATLYDAIEYGMSYCLLVQLGHDWESEDDNYQQLQKLGIIESFDFPALKSLTYNALDDDFDASNVDIPALRQMIIGWSTAFGVMPFYDNDLPKIDAATRKVMGL